MAASLRASLQSPVRSAPENLPAGGPTPADRRRVAFTDGRSVCFCEEMSKRAAKASLLPVCVTAAPSAPQWAVAAVSLYCRLKERRSSDDALQSSASLRLRALATLCAAASATCLTARGGARSARAECGRCRRRTPDTRQVCLLHVCLLTACLMISAHATASSVCDRLLLATRTTTRGGCACMLGEANILDNVTHINSRCISFCGAYAVLVCGTSHAVV